MAIKFKKKVAVNRKFLLSLANKIYNPKTKDFLRLCDGVLQNGPDPTNKKRPMHCGLGELYFEMTGLQPEVTGVSEEDVVDLAVKLSPIGGLREKALKAKIAKIEKAEAAVKKLDLSEDLQDDLLGAIEEAREHAEEDEADPGSPEYKFREILDDIPSSNVDSCGDACTLKMFRDRSKRVATRLREAAAVLPK